MKAIVLFFIFILPRTLHAGVAGANPLASYGELERRVRATLAEGRERAADAVERERVRTSWEVGKLIDEHILQHKERADYGKQVLDRLAGDLGTSRTELYYMLEFARAYPIVRPGGQLSWGHYEALLSLNDPKERSEWEKRAEKEKWTKDRLKSELRRRAEIRETRPATPGSQKPLEEPLTAAPGKLFTYRVVKAIVGPLTGQLVVDLGFSNYVQPEKISKFKEGEIVILERGRLKRISGREDELFTYSAYVTRVLDGDTFRAVIDLGFKFWTVQTLRLRGLDAPEIESADGQEAKEWLASVIASPGGAKQSPVLIRTVKSDKYDRYLADVWAGEKYINQELLDQGLAVRMSE